MNGQPDPLDFIRRRFKALYVADPEGRILVTNEWAPRPAPRFHLMRTAQGMLARYRSDVDTDQVEALKAIVVRERAHGDMAARPANAQAFRDALGGHGAVWAGPAFMFDELAAPRHEVVALGADDGEFLTGRFDDWRLDVAHRQPFFAALAGGQPAAVCCSVRITDALHCAGVETHPDFRRRGYATAAVTAWAAAVRKRGATPIYSTSWDNAASQNVAAALGLRQVAVDFHVG